MDYLYLIKREGLRRGLSNKTILTYSNCIKNFFKFHNKEPKKITKKDIKDYIDLLVDKKRAGNTLNVNLNAIKFLFENVLNKKILLNIRYSKTPKALPIFLTKQETKDLFNAIENKKHKLMIELMYSSGLRVSELTHLKVKDFEFDKDYGWIRKGKGNKDRFFIIAEKLKDDIINHIKEDNLSDNSWLFKGNKENHISNRTIQKIIKKAAKKARINKKVHSHTLRHSFATHLIEDGYDLPSVQSILGHNSSQTTMIYIHMASPKMLAIKSPLDNL